MITQKETKHVLEAVMDHAPSSPACYGAGRNGMDFMNLTSPVGITTHSDLNVLTCREYLLTRYLLHRREPDLRG